MCERVCEIMGINKYNVCIVPRNENLKEEKAIPDSSSQLILLTPFLWPKCVCRAVMGGYSCTTSSTADRSSLFIWTSCNLNKISQFA